jgi:hypothetical protein
VAATVVLFLLTEYSESDIIPRDDDIVFSTTVSKEQS